MNRATFFKVFTQKCAPDQVGPMRRAAIATMIGVPHIEPMPVGANAGELVDPKYIAADQIGEHGGRGGHSGGGRGGGGGGGRPPGARHHSPGRIHGGDGRSPAHYSRHPRDGWLRGLGTGLGYGLIGGLTPPVWYAPPPLPYYYPSEAWYWWDGAPVPANYMLLSDGWVVPYGTPLRPGVFVRRRHGWIRDSLAGEVPSTVDAPIGAPVSSQSEYERLASERARIDDEMKEMRKQQKKDATAPPPPQPDVGGVATRPRRKVQNPLLSNEP